LNYEEIQAITKVLVEEALKREVSTPQRSHTYLNEKVEEALKREVSTPQLVLDIYLSDKYLTEILEKLK
jgi:hypothetical protein